MFRRRFWVSLALTIPTLVFSTGLQHILGLDGPRFPGSQWIPAVFGLLVFVYGGFVFLGGAVQELRAKQPGMMTLISLGILVAFGYSAAVAFGLPGMDFWWELATLITIMLLGHWIEMSAVMGAQNALGALATLLPDTASRELGDGSVETVPVADLRVGDRIRVAPGSAVAADGRVVEGTAHVDESLLTGESAPVEKGVGDAVVAGTISTGALSVEVTRTGDDTAVAGIMRLVADAQASKSRTQLLADRAASWLFYYALAAAVVTAVVWLLLASDDLNTVLERVVAVLVIACPHALGLAIPLAAQIASAKAARAGILVRDRGALENARRVDVVLFDKTGTLTEGRQAVAAIVAAADWTESDVLALAAAVERRSEHPIGAAITAEADARELPTRTATEFATDAGRGVRGIVDGAEVLVVGPRVLTERALRAPTELVNAVRSAHGAATIVHVVVDGAVVGVIAVEDRIRATARAAVDALRARGVRVAMVTGDAEAVARTVGAELGIDEISAEVLPEQKAETLAGLQRGGARVAFVGDGVNDAPALARADVGIAIGAGTDVAIESAGVILASSDPRGVANVLTLSRATYATMVQNLWWAAGYNVLAVPIAGGALFWAGISLSPAFGAVLMSLSTIIVALNAQLLRRVRLVAPESGS